MFDLNTMHVEFGENWKWEKTSKVVLILIHVELGENWKEEKILTLRPSLHENCKIIITVFSYSARQSFDLTSKN